MKLFIPMSVSLFALTFTLTPAQPLHFPMIIFSQRKCITLKLSDELSLHPVRHSPKPLKCWPCLALIFPVL